MLSISKKNRTGHKNIHTVRLKSIRPFADFSSKMAIFKVSEKYLNDGNSSKFLQFLLLIIGKAFWFDFGTIIFSGSENASFFKVRGFHFYLIKWPFFAFSSLTLRKI